jgi:hypothetical protein
MHAMKFTSSIHLIKQPRRQILKFISCAAVKYANNTKQNADKSRWNAQENSFFTFQVCSCCASRILYTQTETHDLLFNF